MKPISISDEYKNLLIENFKKFLETERFSNGRLTYTRTLEDLQKDIPKPTVLFTPEAMLKMRSLIKACKEEVGWHGTVEREGNTFKITDILLYPQEVTGSTTTAKEPEYANWLMEQPDEIFFKIRFQGHSHVNFGVTPSGVDQSFYEKILAQLTKEDYFIFLIMNKRDEYNLWIYDYTCNTIFETADINLDIALEGGALIENWVKTNQDKWVAQYQLKPQVIITKEPDKEKKKDSNTKIRINDDDETDLRQRYENYCYNRGYITDPQPIHTKISKEYANRKDAKFNESK